MKKHVITIFILILCAGFIFFNLKKPKKYKVIEVFSSNTICVDFNDNSLCDNTEKVKIYGFNPFPEIFGKNSEFIYDKYNIDEKDSVVLGVTSKKFANDILLNHYITAKILDTPENNYLISKIFINNEDFSIKILKEGYALAPNNEYKIYENLPAVVKNIKFNRKFNYKLRNKKNGKIHTLDCEYGRMVTDYEIGIFDDEKYKKDYCEICLGNKTAKKSVTSFKDYITPDIKIYFLDFTKQLKPDSTCSNTACKILLDNINNAQTSIDFAILGLGYIPKIEQAIINANNRGVKIRCITDEDSKKENLYNHTKQLTDKLQNCKTDYIIGETIKFNDFLMHNKFFIFDNKSVWLGTSNVSETDLSGYNSNNVIFINSDKLAYIYKNEFDKMYSGAFHTRKTPSEKANITISNTPVQILFSPKDNIIKEHIIPILKQAKKSILVETFVFTHQGLAEELVKLKNSGVDVKIIVDATSASSNYSKIRYLRENGVKIKTENYAGKMHMKTIIVDDDYFISGSMNLSKSGESYNDENVLIIKNPQINMYAKNFFYYLWGKIPNKYLYKNIPAESKESIGSCSDGIDNDYNGKTDIEDDKCK